MVYGLVSFYFCEIEANIWALLSALPMVALANTLPSIAGLGTREAALVALIPTSQTEVLIAFSLLWSTCTIVCRSMIGFCHLWFERLSGEAKIADQGSDTIS